MGTNDTRSLVVEYGRFLRSFGLSLSEIARLHGFSPESAADPNALRAALRDQDGTITEDRLYRRLLDALGRSSRGFMADLQYWNRLPTIQLGEVLGEAGYQFGVRTRTPSHAAVCSTEDGPIDLGLWRSEGSTVTHTTFEYPETELGDDNYPALISAVDRQLLEDTALTFVLLEDRMADWQFLLLPTDLLETLQSRYGERIEWRGRPLLRAAQPEQFEADLPAGLNLEQRLGRDGSASAPTITRSETSFDDLSADAEPGSIEGSFGHGDANEPSAESLAAAADPTELVTDGSGATTADAGGGAPTPDLLDGLGNEVVAAPAPTTDGSTSANGDEWHTEPLGGGEPETVDDVFSELERDAAAEPIDGGEDDDHYVPSSAVLDRIDHENVGENSQVEDGFVWIDPDELTATPWAVHDAMTRG